MHVTGVTNKFLSFPCLDPAKGESLSPFFLGKGNFRLGRILDASFIHSILANEVEQQVYPIMVHIAVALRVVSTLNGDTG